jgi:hypothetical protein
MSLVSAVARSFVAEQTVKSRRTVLLAYLTAMQYAGFTVMPLVRLFLFGVSRIASYPLAKRVGLVLLLSQPYRKLSSTRRA